MSDKKKKDHKRELSAFDRLLMKIKNPILRSITEWAVLIVAALIIAKTINGVLIANCNVPTGSMIETIQPGDRVIGSRLNYTFGEPQHGDVAIFRFGWRCMYCKDYFEEPAEDICPSCGKKQLFTLPVYYVKRVIGVPGDVIEIRPEGSCDPSEIVSGALGPAAAGETRKMVTAAVYRNGEKLEENYLREPMLYSGDMTFTVPEGCYFMLGDNRNQSADARYWNDPYVSKDRMKAKVLFRYWKGFSIIR